MPWFLLSLYVDNDLHAIYGLFKKYKPVYNPIVKFNQAKRKIKALKQIYLTPICPVNSKNSYKIMPWAVIDARRINF